MDLSSRVVLQVLDARQDLRVLVGDGLLPCVILAALLRLRLAAKRHAPDSRHLLHLLLIRRRDRLRSLYLVALEHHGGSAAPADPASFIELQLRLLQLAALRISQL